MAALRDDIERGQRSQEQVLAEVESKHEQEVQTIVTEHAQKVRRLLHVGHNCYNCTCRVILCVIKKTTVRDMVTVHTCMILQTEN